MKFPGVKYYISLLKVFFYPPWSQPPHQLDPHYWTSSLRLLVTLISALALHGWSHRHVIPSGRGRTVKASVEFRHNPVRFPKRLSQYSTPELIAVPFILPSI